METTSYSIPNNFHRIFPTSISAKIKAGNSSKYKKKKNHGLEIDFFYNPSKLKNISLMSTSTNSKEDLNLSHMARMKQVHKETFSELIQNQSNLTSHKLTSPSKPKDPKFA